MALQEAVVSISLEAAADLSAEQYTFFDVDTSGEAAQQTSAGGRAIGVLLNNPDAQGKAAEIQIAGVAKVTAGATVTAGDNVQSDTTGRAILAASSDHVLGIALTGGAVNEVIRVLLVSKHILA